MATGSSENVVPNPPSDLGPIFLNAAPVFFKADVPLQTYDLSEKIQAELDNNPFLQKHSNLRTSIGMISLAHDENEIPEGWEIANEDDLKQIIGPASSILDKEQNKEDVHTEEKLSNQEATT